MRERSKPDIDESAVTIPVPTREPGSTPPRLRNVAKERELFIAAMEGAGKRT